MCVLILLPRAETLGRYAEDTRDITGSRVRAEFSPETSGGSEIVKRCLRTTFYSFFHRLVGGYPRIFHVNLNVD